jgi:hypothetical protein
MGREQNLYYSVHFSFLKDILKFQFSHFQGLEISKPVVGKEGSYTQDLRFWYGL